MLNRLIERMPGSQQTKVFVGTLVCLGICAIPVTRKTKAGHDPFSSERPQDIVDGEAKRRREQLAQQQK